jgi:hypothetical protein
VDERLRELERAFERDPRDVRARLELARALERDGRFARAFAVLRDGNDPVLSALRDALFEAAGAPYTLFSESPFAPRGPVRLRGKDGTIVLGRAVESPYRVEHASIPRRGCIIEYGRGAAFWLIDLGGCNGTWVAEQRVQRVLLGHGDRFYLSKPECWVEFRLGWDDDWPGG